MSLEPQAAHDRLYTRQFFQVFVAVILFMTGVALQFHFGQYFEYLGHDIDTLGMVVGISLAGNLAIRLHIGRWIDTLGCRTTWIAGTAVVVVAAGSMQFIQSLTLIIIFRTAWNMAVAMVMTTVAVFAAGVAPPHRRAEGLGTMGLAGFLGMIIGPTLGDYIFSGNNEIIMPYRIFFSATALCSLGAGLIVLSMPSLKNCGGSAAQADSDAPPRTRESTLDILVRYWPGTILLVGVVFSMIFSLQQMFLERMADANGFANIKVFFLTYGPTAIVLRIIFRRVPERLGRTRTLVGGLTIMAGGVLCLVGIESEMQLILPGFLMGAGHCFIFPSMVDLGAERLPPQHRGMGTSIILGAGDLGLLLSYMLLSQVIERFGFERGLTLLSGIVLATAAVFAISRRNAILNRSPRGEAKPQI